jgi:hypothetical protein
MVDASLTAFAWFFDVQSARALAVRLGVTAPAMGSISSSMAKTSSRSTRFVVRCAPAKPWVKGS